MSDLADPKTCPECLIMTRAWDDSASRTKDADPALILGIVVEHLLAVARAKGFAGDEEVVHEIVAGAFPDEDGFAQID
jgi:hypothetical protein